MKLLEEFLEFENDYKMHESEISGFKYWQFIRFGVYNEVLNKREDTGTSQVDTRNIKAQHRLLKRIKNIKFMIKNNPLYGTREKDIIVLNHQRRVKSGDYFECIYTDNLLKALDYSYYVYEQPYIDEHFNPIYTKNVRYFDYVNFISGIKITLWSLLISKSIFNFFSYQDHELINCLNEKFNAVFNTSIDFKKHIINAYIRYKVYSKYYRKILKKISPKVILEVVYYSPSNLIFNDVAREMKIPVIELQHGTMGKHHVAYNYLQKIKMPSFPDYIFTYGQFWSQTTRLPIDSENVKVVGWPYFEKKVNNSKQKKGLKDKLKTTVLFISQGTIGKELSKIAVDISNKLDKDKYEIIYKLHPGEYARWKREYPWLINTNIEVINHNNKDMHYYFAKSDIQIGVYSTALFEGLGYGLETIIIKIYGYEIMEDLCEKGLVYLARNSDEIINYFKEKNFKERSYNLSYFWERNSMDNMLSEINKIMNIRDDL